MEEEKRTCTPEEVQNRDGEIDLVDVCRALLSKALYILLATVICAVGGIYMPSTRGKLLIPLPLRCIWGTGV